MAGRGWRRSLATIVLVAEDWEDPDAPLPSSDAQLAAEREQRIAQERAEFAAEAPPGTTVSVEASLRAIAHETPANRFAVLGGYGAPRATVSARYRPVRPEVRGWGEIIARFSHLAANPRRSGQLWSWNRRGVHPAGAGVRRPKAVDPPVRRWGSYAQCCSAPRDVRPPNFARGFDHILPSVPDPALTRDRHAIPNAIPNAIPTTAST